MPGFRFRINDLPEEADEPKIPIHKLFLPAGLVMLILGLWAGWNYFHLRAPKFSELEAVPLRDVRAVTMRSYGRTDEVTAITITLPRGGSVEYKDLWPRFEQVRSKDTNLSLMVDRANHVWALKSADGTYLERDYFASRTLENRAFCGIGAPALLFAGLWLVVAFFAVERAAPRGPLPEACRVQVPARKLALISALVGYLGFFWLVLQPLLGRFLPFWVVSFFWVMSGGILGNLLVERLKRWKGKNQGCQATR